MADLVYRSVMRDIKHKILNGDYANMKLPMNAALAATTGSAAVPSSGHWESWRSRASFLRNVVRGPLINPLYLKNQAMFRYEGSNLGITDSFKLDGKKQGIKLLNYQVVPASQEISTGSFFLNDNDFVYQIKRLRLIDDQPFMIETGYIPIKIMPTLSPAIVEGSIFNYLEESQNKTVTRSFMTISVSPSNDEDQKELHLKPTEPVGIMEGVFFLDDGTPFEVSNMRVHYQYMKYNTFVNLNQD